MGGGGGGAGDLGRHEEQNETGPARVQIFTSPLAFSISELLWHK